MPPSAVLVPLLNVILTSFNEQSQVHIVKNEGTLAQIISRTTVFHINGAFHFYYVPTSVNGISYNGAQLGYSVDGTIHFLSVNDDSKAISVTTTRAEAAVFLIKEINDDPSVVHDIGQFYLGYPIKGVNHLVHFKLNKESGDEIKLVPHDGDITDETTILKGIPICLNN